jgi:hypothetical protein
VLKRAEISPNISRIFVHNAERAKSVPVLQDSKALMQNVHDLLTSLHPHCGIISIERSVYKMKIVKLPVEYIRFLNEEHHVVYGRFEYWMFLKSHNGFGWRVGYKRRNIKTGDTEEVKIV